MNENQNLIHKVCRIYCRDKEAHNDLFQEIVLQLWKSFPTFRGESKLSTWMYRIALNTTISGFRKKRITTTELSSISYQLQDIATPLQEEEMKALYAAIEKLTDVEKSIVLLYLEDKPYDEIADITGITANYVAVKMNRIKEKLRKLIKI
ncbi:MAG TPA: sigma-70 family RNA polymerase sigma factor [Chitinophagales bacterium]|nr:sigma-70 family RNA polymerase sigma factor [Chitinophagales bacterium]